MASYDYLRLMRLKDWAGFLVTGFFGIILYYNYAFVIPNLIIYSLALLLFLGFSFSINDCFDVDVDKLAKKSNPIAKNKLKLSNAMIFSGLLGITGLALSLILSMDGFLVYLGLIALSYFYSAPPIRFKSRFLFDLLSHGLFFGALLFLLPFYSFGLEISGFHYFIAASIFWLSLITELRNHIRDYSSDKKAGIKTTVCVLGKEVSEALTFLLIIFYPITLIPIFLFSSNIFFSIAFAMYYPVYLYKNIIYGKVNKYSKLTWTLIKRLAGNLITIKKIS